MHAPNTDAVVADRAFETYLAAMAKLGGDAHRIHDDMVRRLFTFILETYRREAIRLGMEPAAAAEFVKELGDANAKGQVQCLIH